MSMNQHNTNLHPSYFAEYLEIIEAPPNAGEVGSWAYIVGQDPSGSKSSRLHVRHRPVLLSFI
jgi:hypothetical protein